MDSKRSRSKYSRGCHLNTDISAKPFDPLASSSQSSDDSESWGGSNGSGEGGVVGKVWAFPKYARENREWEIRRRTQSTSENDLDDENDS